jgi:hypothetical protein
VPGAAKPVPVALALRALSYTTKGPQADVGRCAKVSGVHRRRLFSAGAVAVVALASACGDNGGSRPALHRPAAAAWCPSVVYAAQGEQLSHPWRGTWDARAIIGLDLDDAGHAAERHGCDLRPVGGKDVDPHDVLTMDLRFNRINVDVTDGVVTALDGAATGDMVG